MAVAATSPSGASWINGAVAPEFARLGGRGETACPVAVDPAARLSAREAAKEATRQAERQALIDSVVAAGLPVLGLSRGGLVISGGWTRGDAVESPPVSQAPRRVLVLGGIHGDEPASVEAVLALLGRRSKPPGLGKRALVVPALNPDGLLVGKKNSGSDVDLNRNFPARNFTREHRTGYDPGPSPLSEPETALLARIVDQHAIEAVVAVHAPFACVNFDGPARAWADAVSAACGWPVRENIGYPTPGSLGSWLGVDRNLPVLTLELPAGPLGGFRAAAAAALDAALDTA